MEERTFFSGMYRLTLRGFNDDYSLSVRNRFGEYATIESKFFGKPINALELSRDIDAFYNTDFAENVTDFANSELKVKEVYLSN